jgi:hypothetical protein
MISIFTPTHRPDHLMEAFDSFRHEHSLDWEWILVPNGEKASVPEPIVNDERVRVLPSSETGVGALKKFACGQAIGDILLELDHDDILVSGALRRVRDEVNNGASFVYSDFANFRHDGSCDVYGRHYGWKAYPVGQLTAMSAFEPSAATLQQIYYAPNHVRAWTREAYDAAGGHDPSLQVVDDHDLVCRTYLTGATFKHIPECLYLYRLHQDGSNTYLQRNAEIQTKQQEIANRYIYRLIAEECQRKSWPMLDFGGAHNCPAGYVPIDLDLGQDVFEVLAATPDSSVGAIRAVDFLEHIPHCRDSRCEHKHCVVGLVNEVYRVLVAGGWFLTGTPSTDGRGAFQDPTHCSFWNRNSWFYYTRAEQQKYVRGIKAQFQATRIWDAFPNDWCKTHNIPYIYADLVALKGQRQPGLVEF